MKANDAAWLKSNPHGCGDMCFTNPTPLFIAAVISIFLSMMARNLSIQASAETLEENKSQLAPYPTHFPKKRPLEYLILSLPLYLFGILPVCLLFLIPAFYLLARATGFINGN